MGGCACGKGKSGKRPVPRIPDALRTLDWRSEVRRKDIRESRVQRIKQLPPKIPDSRSERDDKKENLSEPAGFLPARFSSRAMMRAGIG